MHLKTIAAVRKPNRWSNSRDSFTDKHPNSVP